MKLDFQKLIEDAWQDGGYDGLEYSREPLPPFSDADAAWSRERARGEA